MDFKKYLNIEEMCGDLHEAFSLDAEPTKMNISLPVIPAHTVKPIPVKPKLPVIPAHRIHPYHPHPNHPHPHIRPLRPIHVRPGPIDITNWWERVRVVDEYNPMDLYVILASIAVGGVVLYNVFKK